MDRGRYLAEMELMQNSCAPRIPEQTWLCLSSLSFTEIQPSLWNWIHGDLCASEKMENGVLCVQDGRAAQSPSSMRAKHVTKNNLYKNLFVILRVDKFWNRPIFIAYWIVRTDEWVLLLHMGWAIITLPSEAFGRVKMSINFWHLKLLGSVADFLETKVWKSGKIFLLWPWLAWYPPSERRQALADSARIR